MGIEFDQDGYVVPDGFPAAGPEGTAVADRSVFVDPPPLSDGAWSNALACAVAGAGGDQDVDELVGGPGGSGGPLEQDPDSGAPGTFLGDDVPGDVSSDDEWSGDEWPVGGGWGDDDAVGPGPLPAGDAGRPDDVP